MDTLETQYQGLNRQYDVLASRVLQNPTLLEQELPRIQEIQSQLSSILDKMVSELAMVKGDGGKLIEKRSQLIQQLRQIQKDYNDLRVSTDKLETLRRIRAFEDDSWKGQLQMYLLAFLLLSLVLVGFLIWKRQTPDITATMPSSPAAMAPLT
jgi:DNA repair exonuclease SbcCD ATPase subunit